LLLSIQGIGKQNKTDILFYINCKNNNNYIINKSLKILKTLSSRPRPRCFVLEAPRELRLICAINSSRLIIESKKVLFCLFFCSALQPGRVWQTVFHIQCHKSMVVSTSCQSTSRPGTSFFTGPPAAGWHSDCVRLYRRTLKIIHKTQNDKRGRRAVVVGERS